MRLWTIAPAYLDPKGQVAYEAKHLLAKLKTRDRLKYSEVASRNRTKIIPLFFTIPGGVESWEVGAVDSESVNR